jgi:hypothetical protein
MLGMGMFESGEREGDEPPCPGTRLPMTGKVLTMPAGSLAVPRTTFTDGEESGPRTVAMM